MVESIDTRFRERVRELCDEFATRSRGDGRVSDFWQRLVTDHMASLDRDGFGCFKQTLNFKYSQWCVSAAFDPRLWRMLATAARSVGVPRLWRQARYDRDARMPDWPIAVPGAEHVYRLFACTLWEHAQTRDRLGILGKVAEPALGQPIPLHVGDTLISQDLALSSLEINRIAEHCDLGAVRSVLEIGAGYGRIGYVLKTLIPDLDYHIVDIPPALAVSETYLTALFGGRGLHFHLPPALAGLPARSFDLVINISSFDEMDAEQANAYVRAFADKGRGLAYIKGHAVRKPSTGRRGIFELDYPAEWVELFRGRDPFQRSFSEIVFRLPRS